MQAWAGLTAGICRAMVVHGYTLSSRAGGSRLETSVICFWSLERIAATCRKKAISIIKKVINMALIESGQGILR